MRGISFYYVSNPVPTLLKQLRGTDQPCRLVENEPQPTGTVAADPPAFLTESQQDLWRTTLAAAPTELIKALDTGILLQYVIAQDLYLAAAADVARDGYQARGYRGAVMVNPAVAVMNSQAQIARQAMVELGFTPAARTRINARAGFDDSGGDAAAQAWAQLEMRYQ